MRNSRVFTVITLASLLATVALVTTNTDEARANDLGTISINCDSADLSGAIISATGGAGDTFVIDNIGVTDNCVISPTAILTGEDADHDGAGAGVITPAGGDSSTITVVTSGSFTISSSGTGSATFVVDACSLPGAGVEASPWEIDSQADFQLIGDSTGNNRCVLSGYYRQTANLSGDESLDSYASDRVTGAFTGTYDGDHYTIVLSGGTGTGGWADGYADRGGLFANLDGVVKKVRLSGSLYSTASRFGALASDFSGIISESSSSVELRTNRTIPVVGGLVAFVDGDAALIQYSKVTSQLWWTLEDPTSVSNYGYLAGFVGVLGNNTSLEIRDSYSRPTFKWNNDVTRNLNDYDFGTGGFIGFDNGGTGEVKLVRNYAAQALEDTSTLGLGKIPAHGGLAYKNVIDEGDLVSNFFVKSGPIQTAIGTGLGTGIEAYTTGGLPEMAGLSASFLRDITTFQSKEDGIVADTPSGEAELSSASSTGSLLEQDYRWAIEQGSVSVFIPSEYTSVANYLTRQRFSDTSLGLTYQTRGTNLEGTATGYPALGRVWEICATENDGYPVLVWEERMCYAPGGGSSTTNRETDTSEEVASAAAALGLTEAEYAAFLASGLTLEEFLASRLATTGPSSAMVSLSAYSVLVLFAMGGILLWWSRRSASAR